MTRPDPLAPGMLTAVVLAGGQSRRMGQDKAWMAWQGRPMVLQVAERLRHSAAGEPLPVGFTLRQPPPAEYPLPGPWWHDLWPDAGPMAGWHTALVHTTTPWVMFAPCDAPFVPTHLALRLGRAAHAMQVPLAVAWGQSDAHAPACLQPTFCLMHREVLGEMEQALARGQRGLGKWLEGQKCVRVKVGSGDGREVPFANFNSLEDWARGVIARAERAEQ